MITLSATKLPTCVAGCSTFYGKNGDLNCHCPPKKNALSGSLGAGSLSSGAIIVLLLGVAALGGIGYISKKQREDRFRKRIGWK